MRWPIILLPVLLARVAAGQPDTVNVPNSTNGWYLPPHGDIRVLVLFAEIQWDVNPAKDPQPDGAEHWPKGRLPKWKDELFDPHPLPVPQATVSRYYHDISMGRLRVLGDHFPELITLRESEHPGVANAHGINRPVIAEANKMGPFRTRHGLRVEDFDLWKRGGRPGMPKRPGPDDPLSYDHVMVILRNSTLTHGQGSVDPGSSGKLFGHESDSQSRFGAMYALPFEILKHEFNHLFLGGNNFHSGGGNAPGFESHTLCVQGGWSMMGAANSSLLTCSAWDRDRLGWLPPGAKHRINALSGTGRPVSGDIDPLAGDTGTYLLRDFITSGDALRIRMPFIPEGEHPQWLWVENHLTYARNGSPTDRFHWEETGNPCVEKAQAGLYLQMQIARDDRYGERIYGGLADYLHPLTASGHFDVEVLTGDTLRGTCPFGGTAHPFRRIRENPLSGYCEQELFVYDRNGDRALDRAERYEPGVLRGEANPSPRFFGRADHALRMKGRRAIGMGTNPSTASILTLSCAGPRETHDGGGPDNRTVRLNGIRVELVGERPDGAAIVRVSTGDTRIVNDVVWSADSIVLPPLQGREGRSLIVTAGRRVLIDRSLTPTRLSLQGEAPGRLWFAPRTRFTLLPGATATFEPKSELRLSNGSVMHLMPGAELLLMPRAKLAIEPGSQLRLHPGARLIAPARAVAKLRRAGRIVEEPGGGDARPQ